MAIYLDHPFHFDGGGRVGITDMGDHVRDMICQVLFTTPGERVNRPDFGCGLLQRVFEPNGQNQAGATQFLVQSALQRWLSDVIQVEQIKVTSEDARLVVDLTYRRLDSGERREDRFVSPGDVDCELWAMSIS
jgi:uncharacterized protein